MATVGSTYADARPDLAHAVKIEGDWRDDCYVALIAQETRASVPSYAVLVFPGALYGTAPVSRGDDVAVYLDTGRNGYGSPDFVGRIDAVDDEYSKNMALAYRAYDFRLAMNRWPVWRDFNAVDPTTGLQRERLSFAAIARLVVAAFNESGGLGATVRVATAGMSRAIAPTQQVHGMPVGECLDRLMADGMASEGGRWRVSYGPTSMNLSMMTPGVGSSRRIIPAEDATIRYDEQRGTTDEIGSHEGTEEAGNRVIVESAFGIVQHAFALEPDWPDPVPGRPVESEGGGVETGPGIAALEIVKQWEKYSSAKWTNPITLKEEASPYYIPGVERVGARYRLPAVELYDPTTNLSAGVAGSTSWQHPEILHRLLDPALTPFIVYRTAGETGYRVRRDGFSVERNRFVNFARPFVISTATPSTIWTAPGIMWEYNEDNAPYSYSALALDRGFNADEMKGIDVFFYRMGQKETGHRAWAVQSFEPNLYSTRIVAFNLLRPSDGARPMVSDKIRLSESAASQVLTITGIQEFAPAFPYFRVTVSHSWDASALIAEWTSTAANSPLHIYGPGLVHSFTIIAAWNCEGAAQIEGNLATGAIEADVVHFRLGEFAPYDSELEAPTDPAEWRFDLHMMAHVADAVAFPSEAYLVACYRDTTRWAYDTGKIGDDPIEIRQQIVREDFAMGYLDAGCWSLDWAGDLTAPALERVAVIDDSARMAAFARDRVRASSRAVQEHRVSVPEFPTSIAPGNVARSTDRRVQGRSVTRVIYDCEQTAVMLSLGE